MKRLLLTSIFASVAPSLVSAENLEIKVEQTDEGTIFHRPTGVSLFRGKGERGEQIVIQNNDAEKIILTVSRVAKGRSLIVHESTTATVFAVDTDSDGVIDEISISTKQGGILEKYSVSTSFVLTPVSGAKLAGIRGFARKYSDGMKDF